MSGVCVRALCRHGDDDAVRSPAAAELQRRPAFPLRALPRPDGTLPRRVPRSLGLLLLDEPILATNPIIIKGFTFFSKIHTHST